MLAYGSLPPTTIALRPWYQDEALRELHEVGEIDA
jgi:hypothetical protein